MWLGMKGIKEACDTLLEVSFISDRALYAEESTDILIVEVLYV